MIRVGVNYAKGRWSEKMTLDTIYSMTTVHCINSPNATIGAFERLQKGLPSFYMR